MTIPISSLSLATVSGSLLCLFYFGGLWLTVKRIASCKRPALLLFGSFVARLLMTLCGFYFVMNGNLARVLACLAGFLAVRVALARAVKGGGAAPRVSEGPGGG